MRRKFRGFILAICGPQLVLLDVPGRARPVEILTTAEQRGKAKPGDFVTVFASSAFYGRHIRRADTSFVVQRVTRI